VSTTSGPGMHGCLAGLKDGKSITAIRCASATLAILGITHLLLPSRNGDSEECRSYLEPERNERRGSAPGRGALLRLCNDGWVYVAVPTS
jgi:hypothetical protein